MLLVFSHPANISSMADATHCAGEEQAPSSPAADSLLLLSQAIK